MKTMPPKGGFLLPDNYKVSHNKQCYIFYLAKILSIAIVFIFSFAILHPSTHEAHEHGVGLGAVNFKNPITKQAAYSEW